MNEQDFAEKLLNSMYNSEDLTLLSSTIREGCEKDSVRFNVVMRIVEDYISPDGLGFGDDKYYKYKLNGKGVEFVLSGCWSGIAEVKKEKIKREEKVNTLFEIQGKKAKWEWTWRWLPTILSIAAIVLSIIALLKK